MRAEGNYRAAREAALQAVEELPDGSVDLAIALLELGRLDEDLGAWETAERTTERALGAARALGPVPGAEDLRARALAALARLHCLQWRHDEAEAALSEACQLAAGELVRCECLLERARLDYDRGRYPEAMGLMQEAVAAAKAAPQGPDRDGALALALAGVGAVHRAEGRFGPAADLFGEAIALAERALGPRSIVLAYVLNDLGMNCKYAGRFEDAEPLYRRAEAIIEALAGSSVHPVIASLYHNLGGLEHARGDYERAEIYARRSVELRRASLGEHPVVALDEGALAAILDGLGKREEAEALLRSTIATLEATFGPENHELAVALNNLAAILYRRGDLDQAEALYHQALETKRALLGQGAPELGATMQNLAMVLRAQGQPDLAEALYREALTVMRGGLEPTHPNIARCVRNYAKLLRATGREDEAAALEADAEINAGRPPSRKEQGDG